MTRSLVVIAVALLLAACAGIKPQEFVGPNGRTAYSMRCSGLGRSLDACYKRAGELCPAGYTIVDLTSGTIGLPAQGGTMMTTQHSLAIECK